jgi:hypothetical protein
MQWSLQVARLTRLRSVQAGGRQLGAGLCCAGAQCDRRPSRKCACRAVRMRLGRHRGRGDGQFLLVWRRPLPTPFFRVAGARSAKLDDACGWTRTFEAVNPLTALASSGHRAGGATRGSSPLPDTLSANHLGDRMTASSSPHLGVPTLSGSRPGPSEPPESRRPPSSKSERSDLARDSGMTCTTYRWFCRAVPLEERRQNLHRPLTVHRPTVFFSPPD